MEQKTWKRLLSFIMTFAMILGICTWDIGGDAIKAEASEAENVGNSSHTDKSQKRRGGKCNIRLRMVRQLSAKRCHRREKRCN